MQNLKDLLLGIEPQALYGADAVQIAAIAFDSRQVMPGALFVATRGTQSDGHAYIAMAIGRGARAVVCEDLPKELDAAVCYVQVKQADVALGLIAANFYHHPSRQLRLVGVTGTNGKTTTVTLLYEMFRQLGYKVGLISTVVYRIDDQRIESTHTTPDAICLQALLAQMVEQGCQYCFMEVSSHALAQGRTVGLHFAGGVFSNLTHDHLDYHHTFAEYIKAKKSFFDHLPAQAFALTNVDDRNGRVMVQNCRAQLKSYSLQSLADYRCRILEMHFDGMLIRLNDREVWVKFLGRFNAYNLAAVFGTAILLGAEQAEVLRILSALEPVDGRFESIRSSSGMTAIVDYAHTPDALQNVIRTINEIRTPEQKLYVVVGCGGNRDVAKRPLMADIAAKGGDMALLTSDNPRFEDPEEILKQMKAGLDPTARYLAIASRGEAIKTAVALARPGDIILVAGKGHETYQEVAGVKHHFDDREELRAALGVEMP